MGPRRDGGSWRDSTSRPSNRPQDKTRGGYDPYECISALQKAIRRNEEALAFHWAMELEGCGWWYAVRSRLEVIAMEDVGLGDPMAVTFALQALGLADKWREKRRGSFRLAMANVVCALSRAGKSRLADNMQCALSAKRRNGWLPPIPDEALDKHTRRGKKMRRGFKQFVEEGTKLVPPPTVADDYQADAENEWLSRDKVPEGVWRDLEYGEPLRNEYLDEPPLESLLDEPDAPEPLDE